MANRGPETSERSSASPAEEGNGVEHAYDTRVSSAEFKRRALSGVFVVFSWTVASLLVGFAGNVVLARLLTPHDFGVVAIGATVLLVVGAISEGGIGAGLLRRPAHPTAEELRTLTGLQLAITSAAAAVITVCALPFGTTGAVVALMAAGMPLVSFQSPSRVVFSRSLQMRSITTIDAVGVLATYAWSIPAVLAGLGIWGLASGYVARGVAATLTIPLLDGGKLYRPTLEKVREFRQIIAFGIKFQANWVVVVIREQGLNLVIALIGGVATLGLWSLGYRLLILANAPGDAVSRVTFPAMAHLLAEGRDVARILERTGRITATATAIFLASFVASTPGVVPTLFGDQWSAIVWIFPSACSGILVASAVAYPGIGYLYAAGQPTIVLKASIVFGVFLVGVSAALLPAIGVAAIGIGLLVAGVAECLIVAPRVHESAGARMWKPIAPTMIPAAVGASMGWVVSEYGGDLLFGLLGGLVAALITVLGLALVARALLRELLSFASTFIRSRRGSDSTSSGGQLNAPPELLP
jgi:O-antigen/teichoic acid export membrane protein